LVFDGQFYKFSMMDTLSRVELIIGLAVSRRVSIPLFDSLLVDAGLTWETLYGHYVAKNVLNFFRHDHGYKYGTDIKIWDGREDNQVLTDLIRSIDRTTPDLDTRLHYLLDDAYSGVVAQAVAPA
jgi:hypothetical protein